MSLDILIPKARRNKLGLLVRECYMELKSKRSDKLSSRRVHDKISASDEAIPSSSSWQFRSSLPVAEKVFQQTSTQYRQDCYANGAIVTNFEYHLSVLTESSLVSNGVTHVSVYDASGALVPMYSRVKHINKKKSQLSLAPVRHIGGVSANLYGNVENTAGNYGHWMIDALARLFLIEKQHSLNSIDYFVVPKLKYDFQLDSLVACGIPKNKILEIDTLECFSFDSLICVSPPRASSSGVCPGWVIDNYRQRILPVETSNDTPKRLYISRKDASSRSFTNEHQLIDVLERYDFQSVELSQYNFSDKVALFANAQCIVGLTGAGMTNLMFCPMKASVLELMPRSNVYYLYSSICGHLSIRHIPVIFKNGDLLSKLNKFHGNLHLDPELLESNLKLLFKDE